MKSEAPRRPWLSRFVQRAIPPWTRNGPGNDDDDRPMAAGSSSEPLAEQPITFNVAAPAAATDGRSPLTGRRGAVAVVAGGLLALLGQSESEAQKRRRKRRRRGGRPRRGPGRGPRRPRRGRGRPDVVLVILDDMNDDEWDALPRTRGLLQRGTAFPNYICENPVCGPARASLLTGRASHNTGVASNQQAGGGLTARTIARVLQSHGYETAFIGKYLNRYKPNRAPGWDYFATALGGGNKLFKGDYIVDYQREEAVRWLTKTRGKPRFLVLAPNAPHAPFVPARRHRRTFRNFTLFPGPAFNESDISDKPSMVRILPPLDAGRLNGIARPRRQMLQSCDEAIGAVANTLRKQNRLRSALFIVVSDNGYMLGEHRLETKGVPYDTSLRVTMRAMGPGIAAGQTSDRLVAVQDVATTVARVAGVRYAHTDGRDFRPGKSPDREHVLIQYYDASASWLGLRGKSFLYVERPTGEREYYDYTTDPDELTNLLADWEGHAPQLTGERQFQLATQLRAAIGCKGGTCP